jgi:2-dehydro-3-deoxyphosphogluconate aldolase / (4S)-4-hydroxy-2-oxoglutarate aldolase
MSKKNALLQLIPQQGILPLFFHKDPEVSIQVLKALYNAGIRAVEYTNRGEAALANFKLMKQLCESDMKDLFLGIGTIKNAEMAKTFIDAGADYLICPGWVPEVAEVADQHDMLWVPGCMTPSEIIAAENKGARMIKLFPGNVLGPGFMSAIKELFPQLLFMPTGGVELDRDNIAGWFKAGVCAVGMGSKLITKPLLEAKQYDQITAATREVMAIIKSIQA